YIPQTQVRARNLLAAMDESYQKVMSDPNNLLRPWNLNTLLREHTEWREGEEEGSRFRPCPTCGSRVRLDREREALVCTGCGLELVLAGTPTDEAMIAATKSRQG